MLIFICCCITGGGQGSGHESAYLPVMKGVAMPLTDAWIETALRVTGHFEDSDDPLAGVSGDFDGQGISLGVLQWNIGSGSLQPIVRRVGEANVVAAMPNFGRDLWAACNADVARGLAIVRGWQSGGRLRPDVTAELKAFLRSAPCLAQQIAAARSVAGHAFNQASAWAAAQDRAAPTQREFSWFFDLLTQNGGLKDVTPQSVRDFAGASGADRADDVICDWLAARTTADAGFKDSRRNASLWRDAIPADRLELLVTSFLRAQRSKLEWRADVLNRKGTIAVGSGWVHGERHDLETILNA